MVSRTEQELHLASIYGKLGVRSRTEAAVPALQRGWHAGTTQTPENLQQ